MHIVCLGGGGGGVSCCFLGQSVIRRTIVVPIVGRGCHNLTDAAAAKLILLRQILWKPAAKEGSFAGKTKMLPLVFDSAGNSGGKLAQKVTDR